MGGQKNDNNILELLAGRNNELFIRYFKTDLKKLVADQLPMFESQRNKHLPESFRINHIASVFIETVLWWVNNGMKETPEMITEYFFSVV